MALYLLGRGRSYGTAAFACASLLGLFSAAAFDLDHWEWRTPTPQGNPLAAVANAGSRFVAVGGEGIVLTSMDGLVWTAQAAPTTAYLSGVAASTARTVAVGSRGTILTSDDGTRWDPRNSGTAHWLRAVAWSGTSFAAVGDAGTILTSTNGAAWTPRASGVPPWVSLNGIAWSAAERLFVAVGRQGVVLTSPDGINWTARASGTTASLHAVHANATRIVVVGQDGTILTSTDAVAWVPRASGTARHLYCVTASPTRFGILGDGGTILSSPDGIAWTAQGSGAVTPLRGLAWNGTQFCGVGDFGMILTSVDGALWLQQSAWTGLFSDVIWTGSLHCAVGDGGTVLTSQDGAVWARQASGSSAWLTAVAASGDRVTAVGSNGTILSSPDGVTWTAQASGTTAFLTGLAWAGNLFVAVGEQGSVLTSPDGSLWLKSPSGTSEWLLDVAWSGSLLAAVGSNGTILTSADAMAWTARPSGTAASLSGVVWDGTQFIAVGNSGTILTSPDGVLWTPQASGTAASLSAIATTGAGLVAVGELGTVVSSLDGAVWTPRDAGTTQWLHGVHGSDTQITAVGARGTIVACTAAPAAAAAPTWFAIDLGNPYATQPNVLLHNTASGTPTDYMAAETADFAGAAWVSYLDSPGFTLSAGDGLKTVFFRVRDAAGESAWLSDTILLDTAPPEAVLFSGTPAVTNARPFSVTVAFTEPVLGSLALGDFSAQGATLSALTETAQGQEWTLNVTPSADGAVSLFLRAGAVVDAAGNPNLESAPLTRISDRTAPTATALVPAPGATGVGLASNLEMTFSEAVLAGDDQILIRRSGDGSTVATVAANDPGSVAIAGSQVVISTPGWEPGTTYHVLVGSDCFRDAAGNAYAGIAGASVWSFTTPGWEVTFTAGADGALDGTLTQYVGPDLPATPVLAVPNPGWHFVRWLEGGAEYSTANPLTVTGATADLALVAVFALNQYALTFTAGANGALLGASSQTVAHGADAAPVTAVPNEGYHFVRWNSGGSAFSTDNPLTVTNVQAARTISAQFAINQYVVTFTADANGALIGNTTQTRNHGAATTAVTAVPNYLHVFDQWSDGETGNPRVVSPVVSDLDLVALFRPAAAVPPEGDFELLADLVEAAAGRGIWDLTGTYTVPLGAGSVRLTLAHSGKGKVTGTGTFTLDSLSVPLTITGNAKGSQGNLTSKLRAKGIRTVSGQQIKVAITLDLALDIATRQMLGTARVVRNVVVPDSKATTVFRVSLPLAAAMDGTYRIVTQLISRGSQVTGEGVLELSNGSSFLLAVRGRPGLVDSTVTMVGDRTDAVANGIRFSGRFETLEEGWARFAVLSASAFGQKLTLRP